MRPRGEQRLIRMVTDFVEGCHFERPFHLVVLDARGAATMTRCDPHGVGGVVCSGPARTNSYG